MEKLEKLEAELQEYYGAINEHRMGLKAKIPKRPECLVRYEKCKALNIPFVDGGLINQPYIWLQELAVIIEQETLWTRMFEESQKQSANAP